AVLAHFTATEDFVKRGGKVYFLAGDQDFAEGGTKAVRRLRKFLNRSFRAVAGDEDLDVMPQAACGTATSLKLTDHLGLLLVNSQWWMQDWVGDPEFNEGCEAKTRRAFHGHLMDVMRGHRDRKRLIIASHHPLSSYGEHGGAFTAAAHLRPAPVVGTAWVLARQSGLVPQHQAHPLVHSYVELVLNEAERNGSYVFASGHDANLQYLVLDKQTQLISGTSANVAAPTTEPRTGDFAAAAPGWAELVIAPSGAGEARFFSDQAEAAFTARLPDLTALGDPTLPPPPPVALGPVSARFSKHHVWDFPGFIQFLVGSYYSDAYQPSMPYPVLDLQTEQGGLTPFKVGGGAQSNSIRATDPQGGDWAIRATTKDSSRLLPYPINQLSPLNRLMDHGFTATHPEAALAMPVLAQAVGVLHLSPRLMYLPDQEALGDYRGFITDEVVLLEQRPSALDTGVLPEHLAGAAPAEGKTTFLDYDELAEKLLDKPARHRVDQEAMLRARLLDVLVGDWDRHRGQWRFAGIPNPDGTRTWAPIALDRDQVFGNYDGVGLSIARMVVPQARSLQPFTGSFGRTGWFNYNARDVDALMLNRITRGRWMALAAEVQAAVTDPVIDAALATWHPETFELNGARIAAALKSRRDQLVDEASEFYGLINREVDVVGSSHDDLFEVWFEEAGAVRISVRGRDAGAARYFDRRFFPEETAELNLYALEGKDLLLVHGTPHRRIGIRFVGGEGKDTVASAGTRVDAPAIHLYDSEQGAQIDPSISVNDQRSSRAALNQYEPRENHEPNYGSFMPGLRVNPDDGVYLGGRYTHVIQGFKKRPFAARHTLTAYFATATLGAAVDYQGLFPQSASLLDQQVDLTVKTPTYTRNFYGYTNAYVDENVSPDYYRVRQARYEGRYGLTYGFDGSRSRVGAQLVGQAIVTEATEGRYLVSSPDVTASTFGPRYFGGARVFAETNTFDNLALPRRGVALHASVEGRYDLARGTQFSTTYKVAAATALPLDRNQRFVLLSRARIEGIVGPHPFYFAPTLGDPQLRAYHKDQLAGELAFSQSTDLRIDVFRFDSVVPGTMGVNLSVDHGRVFGEGITGKYYHLNYGGGL
ncbi:MAG: metallophosphoesterase, partial [Myxococcaceae bacterium]|nr:metallophosphoesterase [Myxococcaceae bacterium]